VVRTMLLDRPYAESWDFHEAGLDAAAARLEALHSAAGRTGSGEAATEAVLQALANGLDVAKALDIATEAGGQAARDLAAVLALE
jgi:hypothetical protein